MENLDSRLKYLVIFLALIIGFGILLGLNRRENKNTSNLGSVLNIDSCQTAAATTTRINIFALATTPDQGTTTVLTCNSASADRLSLLWTNEASSSAIIFYDVQTSQDRVTFYSAQAGQFTSETATTTRQVVVNPFIGTWVRVQARANATTSAHLRLVTQEQLAR